jgi:hypothetical protein
MRLDRQCSRRDRTNAVFHVAIAGSSTIDDDVYNDPSMKSAWHAVDIDNQLATLQLLNKVSLHLLRTDGQRSRSTFEPAPRPQDAQPIPAHRC